MSRRRTWRESTRLLASVGIMAGVLVWLQPAAIGAEMTHLAPAWALLASLPGAWSLLRSAGDSAASAQDQIEQRVRPEAESPDLGTSGVLQAVDGHGAEPGPARADQQRRHQQVQAIEHTCIQES